MGQWYDLDHDPFAVSSAAKPAEPSGFGSAFAQGFKRSLPETKSLLYGATAALGGAVGADNVRDWGLNHYQRIHDNQVQPLANQHTFQGSVKGEHSLGQWAGDTLGNFAGQGLQSAAASLAGGVLGGAVSAPAGGVGAVPGSVIGAIGGVVAKEGGKKLITRKVRQLMKEQIASGASRSAARQAGQTLAQRRLAQIGGGAVATTGLNIGQEVGIGYSQRAQDALANGEALTRQDALRAIAWGIPAGLVDTAAEGLAAGRLLRGASASDHLPRRMLAGAAAGAITEGATEGIQAVMERAGANQSLTDSEAIDDYIENLAAGALGGGAMGGISGVRRRNEPEPATSDPASNPPTPQAPAADLPPNAPLAPDTLNDNRALARRLLIPDTDTGGPLVPAANGALAPIPPARSLARRTFTGELLDPQARLAPERTALPDPHSQPIDAEFTDLSPRTTRPAQSSITGPTTALDRPATAADPAVPAANIANNRHTAAVSANTGPLTRALTLHSSPDTLARIPTSPEHPTVPPPYVLPPRVNPLSTPPPRALEARAQPPTPPHPARPLLALPAPERQAADPTRPATQTPRSLASIDASPRAQAQATRTAAAQYQATRPAVSVPSSLPATRQTVQTSVNSLNSTDKAVQSLYRAAAKGENPQQRRQIHAQLAQAKAASPRMAPPKATELQALQALKRRMDKAQQQEDTAPISSQMAAFLQDLAQRRGKHRPDVQQAQQQLRQMIHDKATGEVLPVYRWIEQKQAKGELDIAPQAATTAPLLNGQEVSQAVYDYALGLQKRVRDTARENALAAAAANAPKGTVDKPRPSIRRGLSDFGAADGLPLNTGDVLTTKSGRVTTPFPEKVVQSPDSTKGVLAQERWLVENALQEAQAQGAAHLLQPFERMQAALQGETAKARKALSQGDLNQLVMFLWDESPARAKVKTLPQKPTRRPVSAATKNPSVPPVKAGYIRPIPLKLEGWTGSASELAALAREIYTQDLQGTSVENASLGARIAFTSEGKGEAFGAKGRVRGTIRAELVKVLSQLVQSAVKVSEAPPSKEKRKRDSKAFHTLINAIEVDGQVIPARLTIREAALVPEGEATHKFYDIAIRQNERSPNVHGLHGGKTTARPVPVEASDTKITDLAAAFNIGEPAKQSRQATSIEDALRQGGKISLGNNGSMLVIHSSSKPKSALKEMSNEPLPVYGRAALEDLPAQTLQTPDERGRARQRDNRRLETGRSRDSNADEGRLSGARSRRSGPADVHSSRSKNTQSLEEQAEKRQDKPEPPHADTKTADFRIIDEHAIGKGGAVAKFNDNLAAIELLKQLERQDRAATAEEQATLARYVGWGGLPNAFLNQADNQYAKSWETRGKRLRDMLTDEEYKAARASTQNAHYTSLTVVKAMWNAVKRLGFKAGRVLESSMGIGNFLGLRPADVNAQFTGIELDSLTARMASKLYPSAHIVNSGFENVPLPEGSFALNIGNPPFGEVSLTFKHKPELNRISIHNQFFLAAMDTLEPGGVQALVVSRYLLDAKKADSRLLLARKGKLLGAIRLPDTAFKENARTDVVTDILFLQKHSAEEAAQAQAAIEHYQKVGDVSGIPAWVQVGTHEETGLAINRYFLDNPENVIGRIDNSGKMNRANTLNVRLDNAADFDRLLSEAVQRLPENVMPSAEKKSAARVEALEQQLAQSLSMIDEASAQEHGHLSFDENGQLIRVVEQESHEAGEFVFQRQAVTEQSPWSERLSLDAQGHWYTVEIKTDKQGKPLKATDARGNLTKRNLFERNVYQNETDVPTSLRLGKAGFERLTHLVKLRDLLKTQLALEAQDAPSAQIESNRTALKTAWEGFVVKHGAIHRKVNVKLADSMPDGGLLRSLESRYEPERSAEQAKRSKMPQQKERVDPAPILNKRMVHRYIPATSARDAADALAITLAESGRVNLPRIADLLRVSEQQALNQLQKGNKPLVFFDPQTGLYETANDYLSGEVKRKLKQAVEAELALNVKALEAVQPEPWSSDKITAHLAATWIPTDVYQDFIEHLTDGKSQVSFDPLTNIFGINLKQVDILKAKQWSTDHIGIEAMLSDLLNNKALRVTYRDREGKTHVNEEASSLAELKGREIKAEFEEWIFADSERRRQLTELFNEQFNTRVNRQYDGSHLQLPGKVPDAVIRMRRHQMNAIWRGIYERFVLLDHVVGAGKTFTAIARVMERKRMGLSRKPMIVVPNHLVQQWEADIHRLYPGAQVLAAQQRDFEKSRRRRLFAKIATGDWDAVVVAHSSFKFIDIDSQTHKQFLDEDIAQAIAAQNKLKADKTEGGRLAIKAIERLITRMEQRAKKLEDVSRDGLLTFEQLGVDDLTIDEAHEFKNLAYTTAHSNVRGLGNPAGSERASDLYNKIRALRQLPDSSVVFLTGTPISNSAAEMYTLLRYLAADLMKSSGIEHFDAFTNQFVAISRAFEQTAAGTLKEVSRLGRSWNNMRALMSLYYSVSDSVSLEDIQKTYALDNNGADFPIPKTVDGQPRQLVNVPPTSAQVAALEQLLSGFDNLDTLPRQARNAERLRLMDRARKLSLDIRAVDPMHPSNEKGGKLDKAAQEIKRIYDKWTHERGTQLVFLDRSVPSSKGDSKKLKDYDALVARRETALQAGDEVAAARANDALENYSVDEMETLRSAQQGGWNAYQQLKDNLVVLGIPEEEIRFVQEANNDEQKSALFDAVRGGKVRVLIGSTPRMGAGTNVQDRLVALHHLDATWKPSDIEQREGRIVRQGNVLLEKYGKDFAIEILTYATERTIDAQMWQLNATKLRMINAIRKYDGSFEMQFDDADSISMDNIAALASGNPDLLKRVELEAKIKELELLQKQHNRQRHAIEDAVNQAEDRIAHHPKRIEHAKQGKAKALKRLDKARKEADDKRYAVVDGVTYKDHARAVEALREHYAKLNKDGKKGAKGLVGLSEAENRLKKTFGDAVLFAGHVDGKEVRGANEAAQHAAEVLNQWLSDKDIGFSGNKRLGDVFDYEVHAQADSAYVEKEHLTHITLLLKDGATKLFIKPLKPISGQFTLSAANLRSAFVELSSHVRNRAVRDSVPQLEKELSQAKAQLPELLAKTDTPFPHAEALAAARVELNALVETISKQSQQTREVASSTDENIRFSRHHANESQTPEKTRLMQQRAQQIAAKLSGAWPNAPEIIVAHDLNDPLIPGSVRRENAQQQRQGATGNPEGFYYQGKVYLIASQLHDAKAITRVVFHEVLGHAGLHGHFGAELDKVLLQMSHARRMEVNAKLKAYGLTDTPQNRQIAAEEVLAELAQTKPELGWVQRALAAIRTWLRQHIPALRNLPLSDSEIIRDYLLPARQFVERGTPAAKEHTLQKNAPLFERGKQAPQQFQQVDTLADMKKKAKILQGEPVAVLAIADAPSKGFAALRQWATNLFKQQGGKAFSPQIGEVALDERAVRDSTAHRMSPYKAVTFAAVKDVIEQGVLVLKATHGNLDSFYISAPVQIDGIDNIATALVHRSPDTQRLYLHGVTTKASLLETASTAKHSDKTVSGYIGTQSETDTAPASARNLTQRSGKADPRDVNNILRQLLQVNLDPEPIPRSSKENTQYAPEGPRFSRSQSESLIHALNQSIQGPRGKAWARVKQLFSNLNLKHLRENTRPAWLGALTLRHLAELGKDIGLKQVNDYANLVQTMATLRNRLQDRAAQTADQWEKFQRQQRTQADAMANLMFDATLASVDPDSVYTPLSVAQAQYGQQVFEQEDLTPAVFRARRRAIHAALQRARGKNRQVLLDQRQQLTTRWQQEKARLRAYPVLQKRFAALPETGQTLYRQVRDSYREQSSALEQALTARIEALITDGNTRAATIARLRQQFESARLRGPYFPLQRFGTFWIHATDPNGQPAFMMYETVQAWQQAQRDLRDDGFSIQQAGRKLEDASQLRGASGSFISDLQRLLERHGTDPALRDEVYQLYLRTLPDVSLRKHYLHRKGTAGYSRDALRAFSANLFHGSFQIARLQFSHQLDTTLQAMKAQVKELAKTNAERAAKAATLYSEMGKRHDWVMNPRDSKAANALTSLGFAWYLGATPAAALVNLSQTAIVSLPVLAAKFGTAKALKALTASMTLSLRSQTGDMSAHLTGEERHAYQQWHAMGTIDKSQAHNLAGLSETDSHAFNPHARRAMHLISWLFHRAEVVNREATALAAYRLARQNGMAPAAAVSYGHEAVMESHFDYSNANRARWMQSNAAKVLLLFRQYSLNMTWFLWRNLYQSLQGQDAQTKKEARTKLAGVLGMTGVFSGLMGLPLMSVLFSVADAAAAALGDDDDDPFDSKVAFRNFLADYLGKDSARLLAKGPVDTLTGASMGARVSLDELWLRSPNRELEGHAMAHYLLEQAAGPLFGGLLTNTLRGLQQMQDGHTWRGVETLLPKALKDGLKALRYADEGANTLKGEPLIAEMSAQESLLQLSGFAPARLNERYEGMNAAKNYEQKLLDRRRRLMNAFLRARQRGDGRAGQRALDNIRAFNRKQPPLAITADSLRQSVRTRQRHAATAYGGSLLNPRLATQAQAQARFAE